MIEDICAEDERLSIRYNVPYSDVQKSLEVASIALVLSTFREPFGRTALEAHATGCALISSGKGGLKEVSGEAAIFVDPLDNAGVENALECLVSNTEERNELALKGRKFVETAYDIRYMSSILDKILEKFIDSSVHQS